jgi:ferrochelatase
VLYDLDDEAAKAAARLGMTMVRAASVGTHPRFVSMLARLISERMDLSIPHEAIGRFPPSHDVCPLECCPPPPRIARSG